MKRTTIFVFFLASMLGASAAHAQSDKDLNAEAQKALRNSKFQDITVSIKEKIATLRGTVDVYETKRQAEQRVHRVKGIDAIRDQVEVATANLTDEQLQDKLVTAISFDRVGYGTTPFNSISVHVEDGVVHLAGFAYGTVDADSAVSVAANTRGVKDVVNDIEVNPVSQFDDSIRVHVFRAVYSFPSLNRYVIDPVKPIRIQVKNGHVALYGVVDNQGDKDAAGILAHGVPGVFSVTNNLQLADVQQES